MTGRGAAECRCFKSREGSGSVASRRLRQLGGQSAATELGGGSVATAERHGLLVGEGRQKLLISVETFLKIFKEK